MPLKGLIAMKAKPLTIIMISLSVCWSLARLPALADDTPQTAATLRITSSSPSFQPTSPILLSFDLTNTSDHDLTIANTNPLCDYAIRVADADGRSAALTSFGRNIYDTDACIDRYIRYSVSTLTPKEKELNTIDVTQLYDLSTPGNYFIQAERTINDNSGNCRVSRVQKIGERQASPAGLKPPPENDDNRGGCVVTSNKIQIAVVSGSQ